MNPFFVSGARFRSGVRFARLFSLCLWATLVLSSSSLWAQDRAAAEALFEDGVEAAEAGDFATACEKFLASNRLDSAPGTVLNIADCKEQLGQVASAWQRYREAAQKLPEGGERASYAIERAEALFPRLPWVTLELDEVPEGTTVQRGEEPIPLAALGSRLPVDPGTHVFEVRAPGREPTQTRVRLEEGQKRTVQLSLGESEPKEQAVPPGQDESSTVIRDTGSSGPSEKRTYGWVAVGTGAAAVGLGSIAGVMAIDRKNIVESECVDEVCRSEAGAQAAVDGRTFATMSTVGFAVGAAAVGVGLYLLLSPDQAEREITVGLAPTWTGASLTLGGTL